jgi:hypothetical protein
MIYPLGPNYQALATAEEKKIKIYFVGRLASYKYFNMDAAIENTLNMFDQIENKPTMKDIDRRGELVIRDATSHSVSDSVD